MYRLYTRFPFWGKANSNYIDIFKGMLVSDDALREPWTIRWTV
jgi:hypothetical protein